MKTKSSEKIFYPHINGLKGLACVLIMIGHFLGIYKYAQVFSPIRFLDVLYSSKWSFLLNEQYWLYLFFVISGYLLANSKVNSIKEWLSKSIIRFIRLAVPILFSYLIIYILYLLVGFHNQDTLALFQCDWFQNHYTGVYSIFDVLFGPLEVLFLGKASLNNPYWVLRMMFAASIIIYGLKYIDIKINNETVYIVVLFSATLLSILVSPIITACLIGLLISVYEEKMLLWNNNPCFAVCIMFFSMAMYVFSDGLIASLFFVTLIVCIPKIKFINSIFSSKVFTFLGNISWGVYSFHWPIISSLGALTLMNCADGGGIDTKRLYPCIFCIGFQYNDCFNNILFDF